MSPAGQLWEGRAGPCSLLAVPGGGGAPLGTPALASVQPLTGEVTAPRRLQGLPDQTACLRPGRTTHGAGLAAEAWTHSLASGGLRPLGPLARSSAPTL